MGCVINVPSESKEKKQTKEITQKKHNTSNERTKFNETKKQTTGKSYIYMLLQYTLSHLRITYVLRWWAFADSDINRYGGLHVSWFMRVSFYYFINRLAYILLILTW